MKRFSPAIFSILLFLLITGAGHVLAGTFGSVTSSTTTNFITITGTTNSPVIATNMVYVNLPAKNGGVIQGVSNTNETFLVVYGLNFPGASNTFYFTNSQYGWANGTNNGTLTTNTPAVSVPVPVQVFMQAQIGTGITNQIYIP